MTTAFPYNQPMEVVHNAYTAQQTTEIASRMGAVKARMRIDKIFFSGFMAGCILAFACAAVSVVNVAPWYQENAPGVIKLMAAIIFPFGLVAIILTGADLCTGSFMVSYENIASSVRLRLTLQSLRQCPLSTAAPVFSRCFNTGFSHSSVTSLALSSSWRF